MVHSRKTGFTLVELLLVMAILGILAGLAIPHLMGVRERARREGDAKAACKGLQMLLEGRKAENGVYGSAGTYTWMASGSGAPLGSIAFQTKGNTMMNYTLVVAAGGLTYTLKAEENGSGKKYFETDQTGRQVYP